MVTWGTENENGQLDVPEGLSGVTAIAAGTYYSAAISGGKVILWGPAYPLPEDLYVGSAGTPTPGAVK